MTVTPRALHFTSAGAQAADVRRFQALLFGGRVGVFEDGLGVSERSGTANMSVDVAGGFGLTAGTQSADQGSYVVENVGVQNVTVTPADPTNPRNDLICAYVTDTDEGAGTSVTVIAAVAGTPNASPVDPTVPANAIVLARAVVGNGVSSILNANITDLRTTYTGQTLVAPNGSTRVLSHTSTPTIGYTASGSVQTPVIITSPSFVARADHLIRMSLYTGSWNPTDLVEDQILVRVGVPGGSKEPAGYMQINPVGGAISLGEHAINLFAAPLLRPGVLTAGVTYTIEADIRLSIATGLAASTGVLLSDTVLTLEEIYAPGL